MINPTCVPEFLCGLCQLPIKEAAHFESVGDVNFDLYVLERAGDMASVNVKKGRYNAIFICNSYCEVKLEWSHSGEYWVEMGEYGVYNGLPKFMYFKKYIGGSKKVRIRLLASSNPVEVRVFTY